MSAVLTRKYLSKSWIDSRIEVRTSTIQGRGMFALEPIQKGEVVVIWGGEIFSEAEVQAGKTREQGTVPIDEVFYIADSYNAPESLDEYTNHCCDSNVGLQDEVTLAAKRDIAIGEELTIDYALWETNPSWQMACCCGSPLCRKLITGSDWQLPEVQIRYKGHFSPYVAARIQELDLLRRFSIYSSQSSGQNPIYRVNLKCWHA